MEKIITQIKNRIISRKKEVIVLLLILLIGAFCRLYKIDQYMTFLGDEGRDAIIVRRLLVYGDPILIGPGTSIGNMYLGPLYYYLMAPALLLANYSPIGPAVMIALLGVVTILFVYYLAKKWFGEIAGMIAAILYAISPTIIIYSRSSWNPNIMPFFALLCIHSIWKIWRENKLNWLLVLGASYAFVLQSHYLGLLLAPTLGIFWLLALINARKDKEKLKEFIKKSLLGGLIFVFLMSPLVIFDARHGWNNLGAMKKFFTVRQETVSIRPWNSLSKIYPIFEKINTRLVTAQNKTVGLYFSIGILVLILWNLIIKKEFLKKNINQFLIIFSWLGFALIGLGLYKQEIYDHYYGFFFAAPFFLLAGLSRGIYETGKLGGKILLGIVLILLVYFNLKNNPLRYPPNQQLQRSIAVSQKIEKESDNQRFNLAVIAERNYEDGYQYFLEKDNTKVVEIDAQKPETVTDQLFAVCELPKEKCDPTHNSKAEVANFGWTKVENSWEVWGTMIYKLVHTK